MELRARLRDRRQRLLVRWARAGSESAFRRLYRELYEPVMGYLAGRLDVREEAEDVCSQVFFRFLRSLDQYDPNRGSVYSWTMQMTRNALVDHFRRRRPSEPLDELVDRLVATDADPLGRLLDAEDRSMRGGILADQPAETREMFSLRFAEGMRYAEIADVLGMSESAVKQRFSRTMRELRTHSIPSNGSKQKGGATHGDWGPDPSESA